jgi:hypothetical protein
MKPSSQLAGEYFIAEQPKGDGLTFGELNQKGHECSVFVSATVRVRPDPVFGPYPSWQEARAEPNALPLVSEI